MQSIALSPSKLAFVALWHAQTVPAQPKATTLSDLDEAQDFSELEALVEKLCGPHCLSIEFADDNSKRGCRALEWMVTVAVYNGYIDRSEDGSYPDTGRLKERVWIPVRPSDTITNMATRLCAEVRAIDSNIHA